MVILGNKFSIGKKTLHFTFKWGRKRNRNIYDYPMVLVAGVGEDTVDRR
jgi:hypothetical protein